METHPGRCESPRLHTGSRKLQVDLSELVILVIESRAKVLSMEDKDLRIRKSPCFSAARAAPHRREVCSEVAACTMSLGCFCLVSDAPRQSGGGRPCPSWWASENLGAQPEARNPSVLAPGMRFHSGHSLQKPKAET